MRTTTYADLANIAPSSRVDEPSISYSRQAALAISWDRHLLYYAQANQLKDRTPDRFPVVTSWPKYKYPRARQLGTSFIAQRSKGMWEFYFLTVGGAFCSLFRRYRFAHRTPQAI